ncbi:MAG: ASKHA domain-containing protein [Elusimicrobiota bacterium]
MFKIFFPQYNKHITVPQGVQLRDAIALAGIPFVAPCAGEGKCGKCKVILPNSSGIELTQKEQEILTKDEIAENIRLACQVITGKTAIEVRFIDTESKWTKVSFTQPPRELIHDPWIKRVLVQLTLPKLENPVADDVNLIKALGQGECISKLNVLQKMPGVIREKGFVVTVLTSGVEVLGIQPGDTTAKQFGIAVDIGTTVVGVEIVDLNTGQVVAHDCLPNTQAVFGSDVISRSSYVINTADGLAKMQAEVVKVVNKISTGLCEKVGVLPADLCSAVVVGNTTMQHLFLGITTEFLPLAPYTPTVTQYVEAQPGEVGLDINPEGRVLVFPSIAGFIGGDTLGMVLSLGLGQVKDKVRIGVDLGTNGEIVLENKGNLLACSTAAGPAFEGAQISCGMPAVNGAVDSVVVTNEEVKYHTVGDKPPRGICGSGLVDLLACLVKTGIVDSTGRILDNSELPVSLGEKVRKHIVKTEKGNTFLLASGKKHVVALTQKDVRQLQLAKGAISAGIVTLLKREGLKIEDVDEIFLAGSFGNFINHRNAQIVGLIPGINLEKVKYVGNAAIEGARRVLVSKTEYLIVEDIKKVVTYTELANNPEFTAAFSEMLLF